MKKTKYIAPLLSLAVLFPTASNVYWGRHSDEDLYSKAHTKKRRVNHK